MDQTDPCPAPQSAQAKVPWIPLGFLDNQDNQSDDVLDLSDLGDGEVDDPITSGSDPTAWDPIEVDKDH